MAGAISFEHLACAYGGTKVPALDHHVSFPVRVGSMLGGAGPEWLRKMPPTNAGIWSGAKATVS